MEELEMNPKKRDFLSWKQGEFALDKVSDQTGRSLKQTRELLELCDWEFYTLLKLEEKLKNNHVGYTPGDVETVQLVLNMGNGSGYFHINRVW